MSLLEPKSGPESTFLHFMKYCKSNINDDIFSPNFIFFTGCQLLLGPRLSPKNVCFLLYIYMYIYIYVAECWKRAPTVMESLL